MFPGLNSETLTTCTGARVPYSQQDCSLASSVSGDAKAEQGLDSNLLHSFKGA